MACSWLTSATGTGFSGVSHIGLTYTIDASADYALVFIPWVAGATNTVSIVASSGDSYTSIALNSIGNIGEGSLPMYAQIFKKASPTTGSTNITVNWNTSVGYGAFDCGCMTRGGTGGTENGAAFNTNAQVGTGNCDATVTDSSTGDLVVGCFAGDSGWSGNVTQNQTAIYKTSGAGGQCGAAMYAAGGANILTRWGCTGSGDGGGVSINIKQVSASGASPGLSTGTGAGLATGAAAKTGAGLSAGVGAGLGTGASAIADVGLSAGTGTGLGVGASTVSAAMSSAGVGTGSAEGASTAGAITAGDGYAAGVATANAQGKATVVASGYSAGIGTARAVGAGGTHGSTIISLGARPTRAQRERARREAELLADDEDIQDVARAFAQFLADRPTIQ